MIDKRLGISEKSPDDWIQPNDTDTFPYSTSILEEFVLFGYVPTESLEKGLTIIRLGDKMCPWVNSLFVLCNAINFEKIILNREPVLYKVYTIFITHSIALNSREVKGKDPQNRSSA